MADPIQTTTNQPPFDPLNPTPQEQADMVQGFMDGYAKRPPARESLAYSWGRGSAARDHGDEPDEQRRDVERRMGERMRLLPIRLRSKSYGPRCAP